MFSVVPALSSRYAGLCTISAYAPNEALLTNVRPLITPRSTRSSNPSVRRVEACGRVVAVEPEVQREVVAGARADDQERQVVLGRDASDERLGAVPAGNAQQVGAAGHRVPGEGGDVDDARAVQEGDLGTHGLGLLLEPELRHLPPARPRVHHQERMLHWAGRIGGHALVPGDDAQRRSAGHAREHDKGE